MRSPSEAIDSPADGVRESGVEPGGPGVQAGEPDRAGEPTAEVDRLASQSRPFLIGVRHHSPTLAAAIPHLLDAYQPDAVLVELPADFDSWLPWLADPGTLAPVALAGVGEGQAGVSLYPFADFSPELAAIRWARAHEVPVTCCDLPLGHPGWQGEQGPVLPPSEGGRPTTYHEHLQSRITGREFDDLWDRLVEAPGPGSTPEALRRAGLAVGWALRQDDRAAGRIPARDRARERWMRSVCAANPVPRIAMVVGAFHAPALAGIDGSEAVDVPAGSNASPSPPGPAVTTSLIPYTFALLDSRSGYPAGIRDPRWQQSVLAADGDPAAVRRAVLRSVVAITARLRMLGHPAGPAEARESVRLANDLATLRGLRAPSRSELIEAVQSVLAQGQVSGRGRYVAQALEHELVGETRGHLAPGTPESGLAPAVRILVGDLRLPGPGDPARELRLDPLRSDLDRRREITLTRMATCDLGYGEAIVAETGLREQHLTTRWRVRWTPHTDAMLSLVGLRGVTLAQATEGLLRSQLASARAGSPTGDLTCGQLIAALDQSAQCGLVDLTAELLDQVRRQAPDGATLPELIHTLHLLDQLRLGHLPGLLPAEADQLPALGQLVAELEATAIRQVDGLAGSTEAADVRALAALARRAADAGRSLRLAGSLARMSELGSDLMAAAAATIEVLLGLTDVLSLADRVGSWIDTASSGPARQALRVRVTGLLLAGEPLLHTGDQPLGTLLERIQVLRDEQFIARLPALRGGFDVLSPAARQRLAAVIGDELGLGQAVGLTTAGHPRLALTRLLADRAGLAALTAAGLSAAGSATAEPAAVEPAAGSISGQRSGRPAPDPADQLSPNHRWQLILGQQQSELPTSAARFAGALDELYGLGQGEGSSQARAGSGAGRGTRWPTARDWSAELQVLFGAQVREEVLAAAVEAGRLDVALGLGPELVRPSIDLLQSVLNLAGGLPESKLAQLRPLVSRIVAELTKELATRLRPALSGLTTPRPTRRPGGPLDLARTVHENLASSHVDENGSLVLIPERPIFRAKSKRSLDWQLILVVDVSGSMEPSVIWSALTAAVLAGVPALTTHFLAFSTEVIDFSEHVTDPLSLLLEVQVGGGTHIAAGLRQARNLVRVPNRTLVVVVSDFEEGYPLGELLGETRAALEAGCTLLGCASLDDVGAPRYSVGVAGQLAAAGMPVAALSPLELARWVGDQIR